MADPQDPEGPTEPPKKAPAKKAAAKKAPAKQVPAKKVPAKKAPAKKAPATKAAAQKAPAKKAPAKKAPAKTIPAETIPAKTIPAKKAQPVLTARVEAPALVSAPVPAALERAVPAEREAFGRGHAVPISLALAGTGLAVFALSRVRRGWRAARDVF